MKSELYFESFIYGILMLASFGLIRCSVVRVNRMTHEAYSVMPFRVERYFG